MNAPNPQTLSRHVVFFRWPLLVITGLILLNGLFAKRGLLDWRRMNSENEKIELQIASATRAKQKLAKENELLLKNPSEQERVIRSVLGYIKPNETVIEFN